MSGKFLNINFDINNLPTMPAIAAQMVELINQPNTSAEELTSVVAKDQVVAARVLKIANSSFYSMSRQITNLSTAIVIIGQQTLNGLVLAASLRGLNKSFGPIEQLLWEDSMVCAIGSRFLAQKLGIANPDDAFMAGLFRHMGLTILNNQHNISNDFIQNAVLPNEPNLGEIETETFGATHAEIGAAVLEHWKLSETLSFVALHHSDLALQQDFDSKIMDLTCLINIAGHLPGYFGIYGEPMEQNLEAIAGRKKLNIDTELLKDAIDDFHQIFTENKNDFLS